MEKEQFIEFLNSEEGQGLVSEQGFSKMTKENVTNYLETEEGKAIKFSIGDTAHNNYIKKLTEKGGKVFDAEGLKTYENQISQKLNPQLTPEQVKIKELEDRINQSEKKEKISTNYKEAIKLNEGYGIPKQFLEKFVVEDFEATKNNIETFGNVFKGALEKTREETLNGIKAGSYKPSKGVTTKSDPEMDAFTRELNGGR